MATFVDLTRSPAGGFATAILARLGHRVVRPEVPGSDLDALIYHRQKERCGLAELSSALQQSDALIIDEWAPNDVLADVEDGHLPRLRITLRDIEAGIDHRVTGFVLDHALGFSDELPSGSAYNSGYEGPDLSLPGRLTDHDIGVQLATAALAWLGQEGNVDVSAARAAATTHRYQLAIADVEPDYFVDRHARAGLPFGGVLECLDGYVELVIFTPSSWHAVAAWMGNPDWTRHPDFPNKEYLDANAEEYQARILEWARTQRVEDIIALAARDAVPAAKFATVEEALADPWWLDQGYSERLSAPDILLPRLPYIGVGAPGGHMDDREPASSNRLRPLAGKVVVDFTVAQAGAHAAWVLTQLGADVIKVENRHKPDIARLWTPGNLDTSFSFLEPNAGKKSFLLQWDTEYGHQLLIRLIERADMFLTNVRPAVLERIGLTPDVLREANPGLILSTISTDGIGDPVRAQKPGWAYTFGAASGVGQAITGAGQPPSEVSGWADYAVGNLSALATLHTLRTRTAEQFVHVDTNAIASLSLLLSDTAAVTQSAAEDPASRYLLNMREGVVAADDTPRATPSAADVSQVGTVEELRSDGWAAVRSRTMEEVFRGGSELGIDPYWRLDEHIVLGRRRKTIRPPWSIGGQPVATTADAPWLGEHTAEVAAEVMGLSDAEIERAQSMGVLG